MNEQEWEEYFKRVEDYIKNTPNEVKDAIWAKVLAKNLQGPTIEEYIQSLPEHLRPD